MILITGGRCQGKLSFAMELLGGRRDGVGTVTADGTADSPKEALKADIVNHVELYIRQLMEKGEDPTGFVEGLIWDNPSAIVIADEIGLGIVPVEAFEREYREMAGRSCQKLAAASTEVYRVVCGIGMKIKG